MVNMTNNTMDNGNGNGAAMAPPTHKRQDSDSDGASTPRGSRGFNMALNTDDTNLTVQAKDLESLRSAQRSAAAAPAKTKASPKDKVSSPANETDEEETTRPRRSSREKSKDSVHKSLSATLKSISRNAGPHIKTGTYTSKTSHVETAADDVPLSDSRLKPTWVMHNLSPAELCERAVKEEDSSHFSKEGALMVLSGAKTGRSPKDKHVVKEVNTENDIWWGGESPNMPVDEEYFLSNRERALDYLNMLNVVYVFDGYACWDTEYRVKIRVVCGRAYHALFMHNMLIRPTEEELDEYGEPDFVIYNAGTFPSCRKANPRNSSTSISLNLKTREMVILGTQYAGEMKKGVFTLMHYLMPKCGQLSLHSGCNIGRANGDVSLFFGLSGTGKTTLSTEPNRALIGDDEIVWTNRGVANIEGGCYAKVINMDHVREPEISAAIKFGTVLENVVFDDETREVDYDNATITQNTRASYPIDYIKNLALPCVGPHPKNIVFLCHDAFGVLPPVCKLTPDQSSFYFISGYTAKVAGTEMGVKEPQATFSPCFGGAFLMFHPAKYAAMLRDKVEEHGADVWLVNTGYHSGGYGVGKRIKLTHTRAIIDAIHSGELSAQIKEGQNSTLPLFGLAVPKTCPGVPDTMLDPRNGWPSQEEYMAKLTELAKLFRENYELYERDVRTYIDANIAETISAAAPQL